MWTTPVSVWTTPEYNTKYLPALPDIFLVFQSKEKEKRKGKRNGGKCARSAQSALAPQARSFINFHLWCTVDDDSAWPKIWIFSVFWVTNS